MAASNRNSTDVADVAPGVTRTESNWGYFLKGTKEDLISAGLAKPEWFPDGSKDSRGRTLRTRHVECGGRRIRCNQESARRFFIGVDYSNEERERRAAEQQQQQTQGRKARLEAILATLPPYDPEGLTEDGELFMRMLVALDKDGQDTIWCSVESLLLARTPASIEVQPKPRTGLRLVVDNGPRRG